MRSTFLWMLVGALVAAGVELAAEAPPPSQDQQFLRYVERAITYYPNSTFRITSNDRGRTPAGAYRLVEVERVCASDHLTGSTTVVVDDVADMAWFGSAAKLPALDAELDPAALRTFVQDFLPEAIRSSLRLNSTVDWNDPPCRAGALLPFWLKIDSGYGEYRRAAAVTADGKYAVMGPVFPTDVDLVRYRRELLRSSDLVIWDRVAAEDAPVEIVEFSDLECPACRHVWTLVKQALDAAAGRVNHGMVSYPLTTIHPWAFRAASASWCITAQGQSLLLPLKELFYELQTEMEIPLVAPTARDFVAANGLDESAFNDCYLKQPSLDAVHRQLTLGQELGVNATPTYFVNGWLVQGPDPAWFPGMLDRLAAGEEP
jgi:protein-disulfide isomerase